MEDKETEENLEQAKKSPKRHLYIRKKKPEKVKSQVFSSGAFSSDFLMEDLEEKAEQGDTVALRELGDYYGKGVKDVEKAFSYYLKLAESGDAEAQCLIGDAFSSGILFGRAFEKNAQTSQKWYLKAAAEQNNAYAQEKLAEIYYNGLTTSTNSIEKNHKEAFKWYKKLAENGDVSAQNVIAKMYYDGDGVEQNRETAFEWFEKAAEEGDPSEQIKLAEMYYNDSSIKQNHKKAFEWYLKLAKQGNNSAQKKVADMYNDGLGVEQNHKKAFEWYLKLAENGDISAQCEIAHKYYYGDGVEQNYQKAFEWYSSVAVHGGTYVLYELRDMHFYDDKNTNQEFQREDDKGINQKHQREFEYYMVGAEGEDPSSIIALIEMFNNSEIIEEDLKLVFKLLIKFSKGFYKDFFYSRDLKGLIYFTIGQMYETGKGTRKNIHKANSAYRNAHIYDNEKAIKAIKRLEQAYPEIKELNDHVDEILNKKNAKK